MVSKHQLLDFVVIPALLPLIGAWLLLAKVLSLLSPFLVLPSIILARRLYWAVPFAPYVWQQHGRWRGALLRVGFEATYCMNVVRRLLTLPLRRSLPDFYICGFPKAGSTTMANYLREHPQLSGLDSIAWHEVLNKESHFFNGILGRGTTTSKLLYRSFFPTILTRWWREHVLGRGKWMCFDACPLPACLPHSAERMAALTPDAKLIFMLRDPVEGAFSAELMFRNIGVPLSWSLMDDVRAADPRFEERPGESRYWGDLERLRPDEPLPADLMQRFYFTPAGLLRCGKYADRLAPFLARFPRSNIMFVELSELQARPEAVLRSVLEFVGADPGALPFKEQAPGMQGERRGRRIHPSVRRRLARYYADSNARLYALLGRHFHWCDPEAGTAAAHSAAAAASTPAVSRAASQEDGAELSLVAVDIGLGLAGAAGVAGGAVKKGAAAGPITDSLELAATPGGSAAFRIQAAGA